MQRISLNLIDDTETSSLCHIISQFFDYLQVYMKNMENHL